MMVKVKGAWFVTLTGLAMGLLASCVSTVEVEPFKPPVFPEPPDPPRYVWERTITSSADVKAVSGEEKFKAAVTGIKRIGEGIGKPWGVAIHQGRMFVGNTAERVVHVFDFPTGDYFKIGDADGPGQLGKPLGVAVDSQGRLFVVDATFKNVKIYSRDGAYLNTVGGKNELNRPSGVAVTPGGERAFVVDTGGVDTPDHRVRVFDTQNGKLLFDIGGRGREEGKFNLPNSAAFADGKLYVTDGGNFRVQVFTAEGAFVRSIGQVGRQTGMFSRPKGVALDANGNLFVVDTAFGNVQIFDPQGQLLMAIGKRGPGAPGEFFLPAGIAIDEDGRVMLVDQFYSKVEIYRPVTLNPATGYLAVPQ